VQERYVETEEQLQELCTLVESSRWLALDTEFMREKTYYPQFCLLQLCNGEIAACVDPLRIDSLEPLLALFRNPAITKVFHAGRQDLEIFHHLWQCLPQPLFDTQLAATILGLGDQLGYAGLVQQLLGHDLDKGHTRTDWAQRPLERAQLRYALDDVIYLGEIYPRLLDQLQRLGRESWLEEDFRLLADPATYTPPDTQVWQRVKGRQRLKGVELAVLQTLAQWREIQARQANRPRRWILNDDVLLELARRRPDSLQQLERIRGLESATVKRQGTQLLEIVAQAVRLPKSQWPKEKRPPRLTPEQEAMTDLLMCSLRLLADENHIAPAALASRKELERLATGDRDTELLHGWRGALAGRTLLRVMQGECAPLVSAGGLKLGCKDDISTLS
jgi:ribonuclease D